MRTLRLPLANAGNKAAPLQVTWQNCVATNELVTGYLTRVDLTAVLKKMYQLSRRSLYLGGRTY